MSTDENADVLVIGGGSAGAVVAARWSEDASRDVVLLEGGKAYPPDGFPCVLTDPARIGGDADHDWGYAARGGRLSHKLVALRGAGTRRKLRGQPCCRCAGTSARLRPVEHAGLVVRRRAAGLQGDGERARR